jgi:DNA-binding winged helix-turn-helix (wHTH) protein
MHEHEGEAVERDRLLRDVCGCDWTGGSNVIEAVVSALRRKLGRRAGALETVRGVGYRLRALRRRTVAGCAQQPLRRPRRRASTGEGSAGAPDEVPALRG